MRSIAWFEKFLDELIWKQGFEQGAKEGFLRGFSTALKLKFGTEGLDFVKEMRAVSDSATFFRIQEAFFSAIVVDDLRTLLTPPNVASSNS